MKGTENEESVPLGQSLTALALAALTSVGLLSLFLVTIDLGALPAVALYMTPFVLATVAAFVLPILVLWRASRTPPYSVAMIWGALSGWCAMVWLVWHRRPHSHGDLSIWTLAANEVGFRGLIFPGLPGAVAGLLYAWAVRPRSRSMGIDPSGGRLITAGHFSSLTRETTIKRVGEPQTDRHDQCPGRNGDGP